MHFEISKKTKIVCTIGPASDNYEKLLELIKNGMNVMRLNFSHGDYPSHQQKIDLAKRIRQETGIPLSIMLDTKGPEIRVHEIENGAVEIKNRSIIRVAMKEVLGNAKKISVTYPKLFDDVKEKNTLMFDDGNLEVVVVEKDYKNRELVCRATNTHILKSRKGVNVPFAKLSMPYISAKDEQDLQFGCQNDVDYIAASFVRRASDVKEMRKIVAKYGKPNIPIIAKIENPEGVENIDEIIDASEGIMVARGDLGVEVPAEVVPVIQRDIIHKCRAKGKIVITATQMLDSMQTHPRPTRAEVSDVATAIQESSDAIMLSGESASGLYPAEATLMQMRIAREIEKHLDYKMMASEAFDTSTKTNNDAIANSIANAALLIDAKLIVCYTFGGGSAVRFSRFRPPCPIIAVTNNEKVALSFGTIWGVYPVVIKTEMPKFIEEMEALALKIARDLKIKPNSHVILAGGSPIGMGKTNFMKILTIPDVKKWL